jgi:hypothetical protein
VKAIDLITSSFRKANIVNEQETPSAEQGAKGLESLNDLLLFMESDGLIIGSLPLVSQDDELTVADAVASAMKDVLAVMLCRDHGVEVSAELAVLAERSEKIIERLATCPPVLNGSHLPAGSTSWWRDV